MILKYVNSKKVKNAIYVLSWLLPSLILVFSTVLTVAYKTNPDALSPLNKLSSYRLSYWNAALHDNGVSILGNKIDYRSVGESSGYIIDNTYIELLISNGALFCITILFLFYKLSEWAYDRDNKYLALALALLFLQSFFNPDLLMIKYNLFLFIIFKPFLVEKVSATKRAANQIDIKFVHSVQKGMLLDFTRWLDAHNLTYYLCGGTLLGAVRHHGFIPWDDDVDILMPRDDYEKLIDLTIHTKRIDNYSVNSYRHKNMAIPFIKVSNEKYIVKEDFVEFSGGEYLWLDVFPMDGLYENDADNTKLYKEIFFYRNLLTIRLMNWRNLIDKSKTTLKAVLKMPVKFILNLAPASFYCKKIDTISQTVKAEDSDYVGGAMWGYGPQEKMPKEQTMVKKSVDFEGDQYSTFSCYKDYLKNLYGDYMTLPPKKSRHSHLIRFEENHDYKEA